MRALHGQIDGVGTAKLDIRCRSIHIYPKRSARAEDARPVLDALASQIPMNDIGQRHVASTCASWVRTTYAHRTRRRSGRSQALGRQRSPTMEQYRRYERCHWRVVVRAGRQERIESCLAAQATFHERAAVDSGPSE